MRAGRERPAHGAASPPPPTLQRPQAGGVISCQHLEKGVPTAIQIASCSPKTPRFGNAGRAPPGQPARRPPASPLPHACLLPGGVEVSGPESLPPGEHSPRPQATRARQAFREQEHIPRQPLRPDSLRSLGSSSSAPSNRAAPERPGAGGTGKGGLRSQTAHAHSPTSPRPSCVALGKLLHQFARENSGCPVESKLQVSNE